DTLGCKLTRVAAFRNFESFNPFRAGGVSRSTIVTPTVTGPADAPRPTSAIPATKVAPLRRSSRPRRREGSRGAFTVRWPGNVTGLQPVQKHSMAVAKSQNGSRATL